MEDAPPRDELAASPFFTGSVGDAIKVAKLEKRSLIVYISGENEDSRRMDQTTWRDIKVLKTIKGQFIPLHLLQNSTDAAHFFALYPYLEVPSLSVINNSGMLLKQSGGYLSPEELVGMLDQIIAMQTAATIVAALASANTGSTSLPTQGEASSTSKASEKLESDKESTSGMYDKSETCGPSDAPTEKKVEDDTSHQASAQMDDSDTILETQEEKTESSSKKQLSAPESGPSEEKTEQMLISTSVTLEEKTQQRLASTSFDVSLNKTAGRNIAPSTDSEAEDSKQTSNVKMFVSPQVRASPEVFVSPQVRASPSCQEGAPKIRQFAETLLIQVRLMNGKSIRKTFSVTDSLAAVKEFVDQNRDDGNNTYSLAILYPRKVFGQEDMGKTLLDLSLEDRATLVLVASSSQPESQARWGSSAQAADPPQVTETGSNGGIWKLLSYLNPLSYLTGSSGSSNDAEPGTSSWQYDPNPNLRNSLRQSTEIQGVSNPNLDQTNSSKRKKAQERNWGGKIHTLQHDDNEDPFKHGNTFWNGNSTQFGGDDSKK